ncbi:unnamed protein product [Arctia plantaginis]|uniref:Uncharacterized protein n=1 Tax=Arctia plantaginis TaxID=874455 RepID=A0A8S0Z2X8_ARCPL|nr:unnamed protein product [Arctia plantaginis]
MWKVQDQAVVHILRGVWLAVDSHRFIIYLLFTRTITFKPEDDFLGEVADEKGSIMSYHGRNFKKTLVCL